MVFCDPLQFLSASLKQLAPSPARISRRYFKSHHDVVTDVYLKADVELLEQKTVYSYNYIDSLARLHEPALPPRVALFNMLGGVECSQANYVHAQHV